MNEKNMRAGGTRQIESKDALIKGHDRAAKTRPAMDPAIVISARRIQMH